MYLPAYLLPIWQPCIAVYGTASCSAITAAEATLTSHMECATSNDFSTVCSPKIWQILTSFLSLLQCLKKGPKSLVFCELTKSEKNRETLFTFLLISFQFHDFIQNSNVARIWDKLISLDQNLFEFLRQKLTNFDETFLLVLNHCGFTIWFIWQNFRSEQKKLEFKLF